MELNARRGSRQGFGYVPNNNINNNNNNNNNNAVAMNGFELERDIQEKSARIVELEAKVADLEALEDQRVEQLRVMVTEYQKLEGESKGRIEALEKELVFSKEMIAELESMVKGGNMNNNNMNHNNNMGMFGRSAAGGGFGHHNPAPVATMNSNHNNHFRNVQQSDAFLSQEVERLHQANEALLKERNELMVQFETFRSSQESLVSRYRV